ncbi:MAG: hypothetical protein L3J01_04285 [Thiomicrorhabdus sp.]|nr:hypothetical protein [Thiomicrorhabdus sp.]
MSEEDEFGTKLEKNGWFQGAILSADSISFLDEMPFSDADLIVAVTQSCDIASNRLECDGKVEFIVAKYVDEVNGQFTHNKHPRKLHFDVSELADDVEIVKVVELEIHQRFVICKSMLASIPLEQNFSISTDTIFELTRWLAGRYTRPAFPSEFNNRIKKAFRRDKLKALAKKFNAELSGIYFQITPDKEISEGTRYDLNILFTYAGNIDESLANEIGVKAQAFIDGIQEYLIFSECKVLSEKQVSLHTIRSYKRFSFEGMSFEGGAVRAAEMGALD